MQMQLPHDNSQVPQTPCRLLKEVDQLDPPSVPSSLLRLPHRPHLLDTVDVPIQRHETLHRWTQPRSDRPEDLELPERILPLLLAVLAESIREIFKQLRCSELDASLGAERFVRRTVRGTTDETDLRVPVHLCFEPGAVNELEDRGLESVDVRGVEMPGRGRLWTEHQVVLGEGNLGHGQRCECGRQREHCVRFHSSVGAEESEEDGLTFNRLKMMAASNADHLPDPLPCSSTLPCHERLQRIDREVSTRVQSHQHRFSHPVLWPSLHHLQQRKLVQLTRAVLQ